MEPLGPRRVAVRCWPYLLILLISGMLMSIKLMYPLSWPGLNVLLGNNGVDEGIHLMTGRLASNGYGMYTDVNAQQGPLFMLVYMLLGGEPMLARALSVIMGTLGIVGIFLIAEEVGNRRVGILAALFVSMNFDYFKESRHASVDLYSTVILVFAFYFIIRALKKYGAEQKERRTGTGWTLLCIVISGSLFAMAAMTKLFAFVPMGAVSLYLVLMSANSMGRKDRSGTELALLTAAFFVSAMVMGLVLLSVFGPFKTIEGMLLSNMDRPSQPIGERLLGIGRFALLMSVPLLFGIFHAVRKRNDRAVIMLLSWALPLLVLFALQSLTWFHYYVLVIPPIALLGALGIDGVLSRAGLPLGLRSSERGTPIGDTKTPTLSWEHLSNGGTSKGKRWPSLAAVTIVIAFLLLTTGANILILALTERPVEYLVASDLEENTAKGDWVICGDPMISLYADRDQPPEATNLAEVRYPPLDPLELINITARYQVKAVVITYQLSTFEPFTEFVQEHFVLFASYARPYERTFNMSMGRTERGTFDLYLWPASKDMDLARAEFLASLVSDPR